MVAAAAGIGVGAVGGALLHFVSFGGLGLLVLGFVVGEVVSRGGGRRGGTTLAVVAFLSAVVGPLVGRVAMIALLVPLPDPGISRLVLAQLAIPVLAMTEGLFLMIAGVIASYRAH